MIWPFGATLEVRDGQSWVVDAALTDIGVLGGEFRFGGGFVSRLHDGLGFSAGVGKQIAARCPGRFWIVGETI